ncbi:MAG: prohibitin family protein [Candidatus Zixiibacteriota bacterium]
MKSTSKIITLAVIVLVVIIILSSITIIKPGYVGVVEFFGSIWEKPLYNGVHLVIPLAQVHKIDIRLQEYTMSSATGEGIRRNDDSIEALTKEGLKVKLDITAWYRVEPEEAPEIFEEIGANFIAKIVRPALRTAIRDVVVGYTANKIYSSQRDSVVNQINDRAKNLIEVKGIVMDRILLRNVRLPKRVQDEIDSKLAAEQEAQKMEFVLQKEKLEKDRKVIEAEGIKEANRIISQGLTANYIKWYRIEMMKELVDSPNNTIVIIPEDLKSAPIMMNN